MIRSLAVFALVAAFAAPTVLHADAITGTLSAQGSDTFTSSTITFGTDGMVNGGPGAITGTFGLYLTDGNPITFFPAFPASTPLPYTQGANTVPASLQPLTLFTTTEKGETFSFIMTDYNAMYVSGVTGCTTGHCLDVTGNGYFTGSGATSYSSSPGSFTFTSQLVPGQTTTTFSASAIATPAVPEPATIALLGSGMFGLAGLLRRRMRRDLTAS